LSYEPGEEKEEKEEEEGGEEEEEDRFVNERERLMVDGPRLILGLVST